MTSSSHTPHLGKRHLEYACDRCRSKKIKCDNKVIGGTDATSGPRLDVQTPCSHCAASNEQCTYFLLQTRKAIPKKYVETLENKWDSLTWMIPHIFPPACSKGDPEFLKGTEVSNTLSACRNPPVLPLFPPEDLYRKLVNIYFSHINIFWPLFHHPTFQADLAKGRHKLDLGFAQVLLGICAVASRYSADPRVLAKIPQLELEAAPASSAQTVASDSESRRGSSSDSMSIRSATVWVDDLEGTRVDVQSLVDASRDSAGWKYYNRICDYHTATTTEITLTELQTAHLIYQFLLGMPDRKAGYVVLGAALRRAQAKGLRRNKNATINLENELWKRAYWCLVVAERMMALETTQAILSLEQNIEVDLPLELNDDAWVVRPDSGSHLVPLATSASDPNKPSLLAVFNHYARFSSEFEKLIKPPVGEDDMAQVFIKPYHEWLAKTPRHLLFKNVACRAANPVWEAQSKVLYMMYGFFGVCICVSTQGTDTPFVDEVLKLVSEILVWVNGSQLTDTNTCRLCLNEHSSAYVTDVPSLICLATVTAMFVAHLRAKWRSSFQTIPNSAEERQSVIGEENSKEAFYDNIVDTCRDILTALQESWITARKSLALIEDFISSTEAEETTSEAESGESY